MMVKQSMWQIVNRRYLILVLVTLILGGLVACSTEPSGSSSANTPPPTQAPPLPTPTPTPLPQPPGLEDDASQWGIFYDGGSALGKLDNVADPSVDGTALKISLLSGDPYTGVQAYRNLQPADAATTFDLNLSFYFPNATPIQALEFTMSKWVNNQRWEWALQWENIGKGVPPAAWRLWTGSSWQNTGVTQALNANVWHKFHLKGDIVKGQVHYVSFTCDDTSVSLGQMFKVISSTGEKLAVGIQLDGDAHEDPYQVYIDQVDLRWS
jgi:hypothetical protein